jgi:two-component system OmpR family sensor kinase
VTRGLRPLETVASAVKARTPSSLEPLPEERLPEEIRPVVTALNDLLPRLARALEMQRAFIADAAHELRTPLTAVRLQLQLAERAQDERERAAALASLRDGLDRTTHLVEQLLTLAREEPGGAAVRERGDVDLAALAAEVVSSLSPFAESKSIDLGLARSEAGLVLRGEGEALRALLSNLVDNALRYTPRGGRVDVSAFRVPEGLVIEVHDTGPGIPPEERTRVFDRFYRRAGADLPGSGLGLAIVKSVAERHGATVTLDDGPDGHGLIARVVFAGATPHPTLSPARGEG